MNLYAFARNKKHFFCCLEKYENTCKLIFEMFIILYKMQLQYGYNRMNTGRLIYRNVNVSGLFKKALFQNDLFFILGAKLTGTLEKI